MKDKQIDRASRRRLFALIAILGAAAVVYFFGYLPRERTAKQLKAAAATRRITPPLVNAATVKLASPSTELLLPGNVTPITTSAQGSTKPSIATAAPPPIRRRGVSPVIPNASSSG